MMKRDPDEASNEAVDLDRLQVEALRVYQRYVTEVVEALSLCPWAKRSRLSGRVRPLIVTEAAPTMERVMSYIDRIAEDGDIDIGLLIFPSIGPGAGPALAARIGPGDMPPPPSLPGPWPDMGPVPFRRFVSAVREHDAARHPVGATPLLMADFHPFARIDTGSPARLVSFIRRTPDPTIQLVRHSVLSSVKRTENEGTMFASAALLEQMVLNPPPEPLHQRIAAANYDTIDAFGIARVAAILDDIRTDRNQAYAGLIR